MVTAALREVGVVEEGCANCGPRVEQYLASVKLGKGYPWCAAFLHWCFRQCGAILKPERDFAAAARFAQEHVVFRKGQLDQYQTGADGHALQRISQDGDVGTLFYTGLGRVGHCFMIVGETDDDLETVEGNTSEAGSREGTTVRKRLRDKETVWTINRWE